MPANRPTTGLERARRRRERRTLIAIVGALILVGVAVTYAAAYVTGLAPGSKPPAPPASCVRTTPPPAPQSLFTLNVYNASKDQGVAKRTAAALRSRDFTVGAVSNDPYGEQLDGVGELRFGAAGAAYAKQYVLPLFPGATLQQDGRTGTSVDVVLGGDAPSVSEGTPTPTQTLPADCAQYE
ncbi:LytR cell envelope-related transcriptional attenuator [Branchiibius hedensis]|uniref:LytR cell envelope-related transcriptional attenuator n=1 Tax=Branchiibius hedensis TaxID=672460 RepID=A0A2Y9A158_9MICO|nr:LytR C-terminal domain-containing protein [Branchiibius hedensis]PWJ27419.1 LytR cell envelope-related transcriptional attenuator [Branchiibius hedensis]SSA36229.1 LytR cell envelope-related transcriptional attenuator [Branchiibius hedensis]